MNEAEERLKNVWVLVIGTCHEYQRHQDKMEEREIIRGDFKNFLPAILLERKVDLIVEEAGDNQEVWEKLKAEEANTPAVLRVLFAGTEAVDEPSETIARTVAENSGCRWVDIRPPQADKMSIEERDAVMTAKIMEVLDPAKSVLVICGKRHQAGISRHLEGQGLRVNAPRSFPDYLKDEDSK